MVFCGAHRVQAQADISKASLSRNGSVVQLSLDISIAERKPGRKNVTIFTPRLVGENDSIDFPEVVVVGRDVYYYKVREGDMLPWADNAYVISHKQRNVTEHYARSISHQPWMDNSTLKIVRTEGTPCDRRTTDVRCAEGFTLPKPDTTWVTTKRKPRNEELREKVSGKARIQFAVNRTEIRADRADNARELEKIKQAIEGVRGNPEVRVIGYSLKGYASPEGSYASNTRLARERTLSLKGYMTARWGIPGDQITTDYEAEDWEGFRQYVTAHRSELKAAEQILDIIDSQADPDGKLSKIAANYPQDYQAILENCFPALRRTDYTIEYEKVSTISRDDGEDRQMVVTQAPPRADDVLEPDNATTLKTYRPWLALKTNLLFDAVGAVNAEVEVPLGTGNRWSLMTEYWTPWYVWHHNSRAYEFQALGFELRYWMHRCRQSHPTLTGPFIGVYYANGKYDLEWNSKGDQGEFNSVGATYGYGWPLSRHWNMEVSLSAGAFWGPKRHYNGEFNDTHLIWKYTGRTFYAGPTKLKLSLVWLIGPRSRQEGKGGRQSL